MKVVISEENLKDFISKLESINAFNMEALIEFNQEQMEICCMDSASVGLINLDVMKEYFLEYEVKDIEKVKVMLKNVIIALKTFRKVNVTIEATENEMTIISSDRKKGFTFALLEPFDKKQKLPDLDFDVEFQISRKIFHEAIKDIKGFSDVIGIEMNKENLYFDKGNSEQIGGLTNFFNKVNIEDDPSVVIKKEGNAKGKYSIDYLMNWIKFIDDGDINVAFKTDYPLKLMQKDTHSKSIFVLAPRVDSL